MCGTDLAHLRADAVLVSDTEMQSPGHPSLVYGLRGNLLATLDVRGPDRDLHAGRYGGAVHNPVQVLAEMISTLHDPDGRVAIPDFYAHVLEVGMDERRELRRSGLQAEQLPIKLGVPEGWGEVGYSPAERTTIRPALVAHGITGGGEGAIVPRRARAYLGIRLVPDQEPHEIARLLRRHIAAITPPSVRVTLAFRGGARPVVIPRDHPPTSCSLAPTALSFTRVWSSTKSSCFAFPVRKNRSSRVKTSFVFSLDASQHDIPATLPRRHFPTCHHLL